MKARTQVQRYIRLNELSPQLQQMVDDKKIAMTPAVELSYLKPEEQTLLLDTIESEQATPSLSQAQRLKKFSQEGHLNEDSMLAIMSEEKKPEKNDLTIKADKLQKYFPKIVYPAADGAGHYPAAGRMAEKAAAGSGKIITVVSGVPKGTPFFMSE